MGLWRVYVVVLLGAAACNPYGGAGAFHCDSDEQCSGGTCQPSGACSFADSSCASGQRYGSSSGALSNTCVDDLTPGDAADAPGDGDIDATDGPPDTPPPPPFCDAANEPTLVGCWQFEGALTDASGDNNTTTAAGTAFVAGKVGMGLELNANSLVSVADSASLAPPAITVEAWIHPSQLPAGTARMGIFDNDSSYGLFVNPNAVTCTMTVSVTGPAVAVDAWTHVACTYDGTTVRLYENGAQVAMMAGSGALTTGNTNGSVIGGNSPSGDQLVGIIDQVRVWNAARTAAQIAAAATP